jgi:hypothetical protein
VTNSKGLDIEKIIKTLKKDRKVFHSEDDLKFSIATVIKQKYKDADVRLERPMKIAMMKKADSKKIEKTISIDITVFLEYDVFFLELKYKTKELSKEFEKKLVKYMDKDDEYELKDQGACDIGRFLFRKDIYRLEQAIKKLPNSNCKGYFIVITNDPGYTEDISRKTRLGKMYSFHDNKELVALDPGWNYKQDNGTYVCSHKHPKDDKHWTCISDRAFKLDLKKDNKYKVEWKRYFPELIANYAETDKEKKEAFRYCIVEVSE